MSAENQYLAQRVTHAFTCICALSSITTDSVGLGIIITSVIAFSLAIAAWIAAYNYEFVAVWHILCTVSCIVWAIFWIVNGFSAHPATAIFCLLVTAMETVFSGATVVELVVTD